MPSCSQPSCGFFVLSRKAHPPQEGEQDDELCIADAALYCPHQFCINIVRSVLLYICFLSKERDKEMPSKSSFQSWIVFVACLLDCNLEM